MTKYAIDAHVLRTAVANQAPDDDVRDYLRGVLLRGDGVVVGTSGSTLFRSSAKLWPEGAENVTIRLGSAIPKTAFTCVVDIEAKTVDCFSKLDKQLKTIPLQLVDGQFPTYERVIPTNTSFSGITGREYLAFDVALMTRFAELGFCDITADSRPESLAGSSAVMITPIHQGGDDALQWPAGTVGVFMPCRK